MAKYVGKIFKVDDSKLKIRGTGAHYVHVKWYNPFTRKFRCRIITSLEKKKIIPKKERETMLSRSPYYKAGSDTYNIFNKGKYHRLRNGDIEPIPINKTSGFEVWSGYQDTRDLHISVLKGKKQRNMHIKK